MTGTPVEKENPDRGKYSVVSKFAIVPIINEKNPAWKVLQKRGLSKSDFEKIYFRGDQQQLNFAFNNVTVPIKVYTRGACASATFSQHFDKKINDLANLDTKIADDKVLLQNVLNDTLGVAYNNLGFVYNLQSRKQTAGIKVVPVDLNGNGTVDREENFYDNLRIFLKAVNDGRYPSPPARNLYFLTKGKTQKKEVQDFFKWVLSDGQKFVDVAGYVALPKGTIQDQLKKLAK